MSANVSISRVLSCLIEDILSTYFIASFFFFFTKFLMTQSSCAPFDKGHRDRRCFHSSTCRHSTLYRGSSGKHNSRFHYYSAHLLSMRCAVLHLMALLVHHRTKPSCSVFFPYQAIPKIFDCSSCQE